MKLLLTQKYSLHHRKISALMIALLLVFYIYKILGNAGGDLMLRVAEARYFINGINPYDVYIGRVAKIEAYGYPNAYSFISYYFAAILTFIKDDFWQKIVFSILDIVLLLTGISLAKKMIGDTRQIFIPIVILALLSSVYFWQHVGTLNYNLIAAFGLILAFYGISQKNNYLGLMGIIIIGLKPSLAIPALMYLIIAKNWKLFFYAVIAYSALLLGACYLIDTNPVDILLQLKDTQSKFSNGYTNGFFFFLRKILGDQFTNLGIVLSFIVMLLCRKVLHDPLVGLMLTITLGISLFYNQVHAWIIIYPMIIYGISQAFSPRKSYFTCALLLIFIMMPRLAGQFNTQNMDTFVAIHNVFRFGLLYLACYYLIKYRTDDASPTSNMQSPAVRLV